MLSARFAVLESMSNEGYKTVLSSMAKRSLRQVHVNQTSTLMT